MTAEELRDRLILLLDDLSIGDLDYPAFARKVSDLVEEAKEKP